MKLLLLAATIEVVAIGCAWTQEPAPAPTADEIMSRVAANQSKSQEERKQWVYTQKQHLRMLRSSGKMAREEWRDYVIAPKSQKTDKELVHFDGKYQRNGKSVSYSEPGYKYKGLDVDGDLINDLSEELTSDKEARDGLSHDLFPFIPAEQVKYDFKLKGTETYRGRPAFRIAFQPKPHTEDAAWKGEVLVDAEEYQPVYVNTKLAWGIPKAVQILLGTNIKGLGFSLAYQKFADGVWFPVSYGGEFEVRAVFFYKRTISVAMTNGDFRHTDVTTNVAYSMDDKW